MAVQAKKGANQTIQITRTSCNSPVIQPWKHLQSRIPSGQCMQYIAQCLIFAVIILIAWAPSLASQICWCDPQHKASCCPESGRYSRRPSWSWRRQARRQTRTHLRIVRIWLLSAWCQQVSFLAFNHPVGLVELFAINLTLSYPCMTHAITTSGTPWHPYSLPSFDNWLVPSSAKVGSACSVLPACCLIEQLLSPKWQSCNMMVYMLHGWQTLKGLDKNKTTQNIYIYIIYIYYIYIYIIFVQKNTCRF